jgi:hypothetical protein
VCSRRTNSDSDFRQLLPTQESLGGVPDSGDPHGCLRPWRTATTENRSTGLILAAVAASPVRVSGPVIPTLRMYKSPPRDSQPTSMAIELGVVERIYGGVAEGKMGCEMGEWAADPDPLVVTEISWGSGWAAWVGGW